MNFSLANRLTMLYLRLVISMVFTLLSSAAYAFDSNDDFIRAAKFDDVQTIQALLENGFNPNLVEPMRGESALMLCVREDSVKVFEALLRHPKLNLDLRASNGDTALMLAAYLEKQFFVDRLISAGARINQPGWTALHYAAAVGNAKIVGILIENHATVDAESPNKTTPLMMAARRGDRETVELLVNRGADISLKNMQGWNAIDFANETEMRQIASYLTEKLIGKKALQ
jgi:ankyrin repeat protein